MIKFGTGGWREIIADGFTKENIRLLTAGLCRWLQLQGHGGSRICLGYDRRFLSKESMFWAAEVLAGYGFRPWACPAAWPSPPATTRPSTTASRSSPPVAGTRTRP